MCHLTRGGTLRAKESRTQQVLLTFEENRYNRGTWHVKKLTLTKKKYIKFERRGQKLQATDIKRSKKNRTAAAIENSNPY